MEEAEFKLKLGQQIKKLRMAAAMKQVDLAYACEIDRQNMYRIETGSENLTLSTLWKIAKALNVPVAKLFDFE